MMRSFGTLSLGVFLSSLSAVGCSASAHPTGESGEASAALGDDGNAQASSIPTIRFNADWTVATTGKLLSGRKVRIEYADDRMPTCRGNLASGPGWAVTGFVRIGGEPVRSFAAAGLMPSGQPENVIELPKRMGDSDVEIWFQNTSRWGCMAYDSNYGDNFHFTAAAPPEAPDWMGDVRYVSARATCDGSPCENDRKPFGPTVRFDSWSRQRAAFNEVSFRVYEPNVTDWDNANAWSELDVQVHYRARRTGAFVTRYAPIDRRVGNDLRYRFDVKSIDPFDVSHGPHPACPDADVRKEGMNIEADVEMYFTVNGVDLRPSPGQTFHLSFEDAASQWPGCRL